MKNEDYNQLELFNLSTKHQEKSSGEKFSLLKSFRKHEKVIMLAISFIVISIISFSLGVEKGKRLFSNKTKANLDLAASLSPRENMLVISRREEAQEAATYGKKEAVNLSESQNSESSGNKESDRGKYIIQLATYQTREPAEREAVMLKKKGLNPIILSKGKFIVLYVGRFSDEDNAKSKLSELKKRYRDCILRRM